MSPSSSTHHHHHPHQNDDDDDDDDDGVVVVLEKDDQYLTDVLSYSAERLAKVCCRRLLPFLLVFAFFVSRSHAFESSSSSSSSFVMECKHRESRSND